MSEQGHQRLKYIYVSLFEEIIHRPVTMFVLQICFSHEHDCISTIIIWPFCTTVIFLSFLDAELHLSFIPHLSIEEKEEQSIYSSNDVHEAMCILVSRLHTWTQISLYTSIRASYDCWWMKWTAVGGDSICLIWCTVLIISDIYYWRENYVYARDDDTFFLWINEIISRDTEREGKRWT